MCDREQDLHPQFLKWLERLQRSGDQQYNCICMLSSRIVPMVQAADFVAYLMREHLEKTSERKPPNPLLARLTETPMRTGSVQGDPMAEHPEWTLWDLVNG